MKVKINFKTVIAIFEKNTDIFRKYQEQIDKQHMNNTIEVPKNILNTYQSSYAQFSDNIYKLWHNFNILKHTTH